MLGMKIQANIQFIAPMEIFKNNKYKQQWADIRQPLTAKQN